LASVAVVLEQGDRLANRPRLMVVKARGNHAYLRLGMGAPDFGLCLLQCLRLPITDGRALQPFAFR